MKWPPKAKVCPAYVSIYCHGEFTTAFRQGPFWFCNRCLKPVKVVW